MVAVNEMNLVQPMVAMMGVTALVWLFMYVRRLGYMTGHGVDAQSVNTPQKMAAALPEAVEFPSNNLKNLFELPVLFYGLCLLLMQQGWVTPLEVQAAWAFVVLRALHSAIHCTVNIVMWRFAAYAAASGALWFLLARVALRAWA
ncbi:MAG TPA: MAPEG family protein [Aquabacterium sp.]|uniref:MAPEG family protein n=1 Tax=Aquabacterium sp. TaxID=1872578 RepID=UPI002E315E41|nr:MAPEG family protein [Aquabacterium sp.]HEX5372987.1 MAPEG family protein [Aquabacterium sp.]